jgi:hypothetical protein
MSPNNLKDNKRDLAIYYGSAVRRLVGIVKAPFSRASDLLGELATSLGCAGSGPQEPNSESQAAHSKS